MSQFKHIETALIHAGSTTDPATGAVNVPIYQTSTFRQRGLGDNDGWEYARTGNPTRAALESLIADLEDGKYGFAFGSGMAAITAVLMLLEKGDNIIISDNVYGGTFRVLNQCFRQFGLTFEQVDTTDEKAFEAAIRPDTKAVLLESPANPLLTVTDIQKLSDIAHQHNLTVIVDNTFMTPYLQKPLDLGADIVVHSATKYLGGQSDVVAGLAVTKDQKTAESLAFIQNSTGGVLGPFDSFLLIRGIKTLGVRMDRHTENALKIAEWLTKNPAVKKVYYPGLPDAQGHEIQMKQARNGGAMISFELDDENYDTRAFFAKTKIIALAESLGGVESLLCHPASMTHAAIPKEIRDATGITEGLIRLSVGIENVEDLIGDLDQAIRESKR